MGACNYFEREFEKRRFHKINGESPSTQTPILCSVNEDRAAQIWQNLRLEKCSEAEKQTIEKLCSDFANQFYLKGDALSYTDKFKHKIKLIPNAKPVFVRQYRIPDSHKKILAQILEDYERQGIIEKCQSEFNSPIMLLGKKDGTGDLDSYRLVVDYRKLNQITEVQYFPIPLIDDILNGLAGSLFYSCLDIKHAYWQIKLADEESRNASAFSANHFQYRWIRMPMGLSASPITWTLMINTILEKWIGRGVYVYLDDVIVYAKNKEEHDQILWQTMAALKEHNLQLKITKCNFYAREFEYLGHIISKEGIKANPKKVEVIHDYPRPKTVKHIQRFLGMCNYFRRYVRNYAKLAKPLTMLLRKEQPFMWSEAQQKSFDALKTALAEEVTLAFPGDEQLYVTCDSSAHSIGGMLSTGELPNDRPIYFFSKTLNDVQKRYSTIERELLAIVESIKAFRVYLYGRFFILITDHKPLCHLFNMKNCNSRMFRQKLELMDYNFKIIYRPGAQNHVADALSRLEPLSIEEMLEREKIINAMTRSGATEIANENISYEIEELSGTIMNRRNYDLIFHIIPSENDTLRNRIMNKFGATKFTNEFRLTNKVHYYCQISNQFANRQNYEITRKCVESILKISENIAANNIAVNIDFDNIRHYIVIKRLFQEIFAAKAITTTFYLNKILELKEREDIEEILKLFHDGLTGGHVGATKMRDTIAKFYKWDKMNEDIKEFVSKCPICEKTKVKTNVKVPMQISSLGECLMDHVFIDFVGPILKTRDGNKYIFTILCDLTKFLVAVPTQDCTALTAANCILEHILCRYNFPSRLISDNAQDFTSQIIKELTKLFNIKKIFSTRYHPQSNIVERSHRTLNAYLRAFSKENKEGWDQLLKFATFVYNNTIHTTTGYTPHELAHGFRIQIPNQLTKSKPTYNYDSLADLTRNTIAKSLELAKSHLYEKKLQNKKQYDVNTKCEDIAINDLILIRTPKRKHKFDPVYEGPYRVIETSESYITVMKNGKKIKYHKNFTKKAHANYDRVPPEVTPVINM